MSLMLSRGALAIGIGARRGALPTVALRSPRRLGSPTAQIDLLANPTPRVSMSLREFGKKSRGKKQEGKHKELGGMSRAMQGRMKLKEKRDRAAKAIELKERFRLQKLQAADPDYKPPVIPHRMEKGPEDWDFGFRALFSPVLRRVEQSASIRKIIMQNIHLKDLIQRVQADIKEAGYGWKDDQLKVERFLTSLHYESRLDWMKAINNYRSKVSYPFIHWKENNVGNSMLPTIVPGVDNTLQIPMSPSTVRSVKKGQVGAACFPSNSSCLSLLTIRFLCHFV